MGSNAKAAAKRLTSGRGSASRDALTKKELKEILDSVLREIDVDPDDGPRLSAAAAPLRIEFPDLKLVLNLSRADRGRHCLHWNFSSRSAGKPKLRLSMESSVANRLFQGRENPAIAIARGRLRTRVEDAGAALRFFPAAKPLFSRYRQLVSEKYPHLAID
ncbi:MAG TPA: SCP2 sterol-binding domain-containing protein [Solirubrobacterales bacterium]|nr:SCP2 sterol-binding domain-containing protein [Solirubrobacterales bacterium]